MAVKAVLFGVPGTLVERKSHPRKKTLMAGAACAHAFAVEKGYSLGEAEAFEETAVSALEKELRNARKSKTEVVGRRVIEAVLNDLEVKMDAKDWDGFELAWYRPLAEGGTVTPGSEAALMGLLERGAKIAATADCWWGDGTIEWELDRLGLWEYFDNIFVTSTLGHPLTSAKFFEAVLRRMDAPAGATVFVGPDADDQIEAATSAGLRAIRFGVDVPDMDRLLKRIGGMML